MEELNYTKLVFACTSCKMEFCLEYAVWVGTEDCSNYVHDMYLSKKCYCPLCGGKIEN